MLQEHANATTHSTEELIEERQILNSVLIQQVGQTYKFQITARGQSRLSMRFRQDSHISGTSRTVTYASLRVKKLGQQVDFNFIPTDWIHWNHSQTDCQRFTNNCSLIFHADCKHVAISISQSAQMSENRLRSIYLQKRTRLNWLHSGYIPRIPHQSYSAPMSFCI